MTVITNKCDEMKELEVAGTPELSPALVP